MSKPGIDKPAQRLTLVSRVYNLSLIPARRKFYLLNKLQKLIKFSYTKLPNLYSQILKYLN